VNALKMSVRILLDGLARVLIFVTLVGDVKPENTLFGPLPSAIILLT